MKFKSIISYFAIIAMALSSVQCEEATTSTDDENDPNSEDVELVITPSAFEMKLTDDCIITFTASIGDEDVSNDSTLELWYIEPSGNILSVKDNTYSVSEEGEYNFYAYCSYGSKILESEVITVNVFEDTTLYLKPSAELVEIGSQVNFSVYVGTNDVSSSDLVELYISKNGEAVLLDELSYTIEDSSDYKFCASYTFNDEIIVSEEQIVSGMEWNDNAFKTRTLVLQATGTGCGWCPGAVATILEYNTIYGGDDAVVVSAHGYNNSDIMNSYASLQLISNLEIKGFPTLLAGSIATGNATNVDFLSVVNDAYAPNGSGLNSVVTSYTATPAATGIKASSSIESDGIAISAEIMVREEGYYGVGAMVLEDDIYAVQSKFETLNSIDFGDYDINNHHNVLQGVYPRDSYLFTNLGGISAQSARSGYRLNCTIPFSEMNALQEIDNCSIVVYTYNRRTYLIDNIIKVGVGETIDYQYEN